MARGGTGHQDESQNEHLRRTVRAAARRIDEALSADIQMDPRKLFEIG